MLKLKNIVKTYTAGDTTVNALRGISLDFRKSEFVAVLGPSGCGKTTLLNIIGGLDQYNSGDLIINDVSTKKYRDADWDTYRNKSIGFVFQSYNLIPHQSVLANVELAMTLSGVSKAERRRRAAEALASVGLSDQLKKKPNQMSGGQMQRVAVARALVNNPDILLADEPTGALDSETSLQLMETLKEISKSRLIIMVTHNPDLAEKYATRTVRMLDGNIISDSNPLTPEEKAEKEAPRTAEATAKEKKSKTKKPSMSFFTALSLSLNNLMTKKARTFLTSFAGSIGIIGIALITALSSGVQSYINRVQEDTLSSYPIEIEAESVDMGTLIGSLMGVGESSKTEKTDEELGENVYSSAVMYELLNTLTTVETTKNNLSAFREYLNTPDESGKRPLDELATAIKEDYNVDLSIYASDKGGKIIKSDTNTLMTSLMESFYGMSSSSPGGNMASSFYSRMQGFNIWEEMLAPSEDDQSGYLVNSLVRSQYEVINGEWPREYNEVVLIVDRNNTVSDLVLFALGLISADEMSESFKAAAAGEHIKTDAKSWSFDDIRGLELKMVPISERYAYNSASDSYTDLTETDAGLSYLFGTGEKIKITGIVRASEDAVSGMLSGSIGYTSALTEYVIDKTGSADIVKKQLDNLDTDIITGLPFKDSLESDLTESAMAAAVREKLAEAPEERRAEIYVQIMSQPTEEYINSAVSAAMAGMTRESVEEALFSAFTEQMQSADPDAVRQYIASMDDQTLFGYVAGMLTEKITAEYSAGVKEQLLPLGDAALSAMYDAADFTDAQYASLYEEVFSSEISDSTYEDNMKLLGYVDKNSPDRISIYAATFADKEKIAEIISTYNGTVSDEDQITYVDYVALLMSSVTTIINAISYILMAFVSVSLIVSSIMIGIITYISVLERTKEIGILRAIGASKRDISQVFNAETLIVGFSAGVIGIGVTLLLCIPINIIIRHITKIQILGAALPPAAAVLLVAISMVLTLVAGLIPSLIAAKKDPVVALRSE